MYKDEDGNEIFGRINKEGNVRLFCEDGNIVTRLDENLYPIDIVSDLSVRYEHPRGIVISKEDADKLGIEIEI